MTLKDFIIEKSKGYIEPQRAGVPKGDPIGLSEQKYRASLYRLYDIKLKDLRKTLNIPYGVLRVWNTEQAFKESIALHSLEYTDVFVSHLENKAKRESQSLDNFLKQPINTIATSIPTYDNDRDMEECRLFSPALQILIAETLLKKCEEVEHKDYGAVFKAYSLKVIRMFNGRRNDVVKKAEKKLYHTLRKRLIMSISDTFLKRNITDKDKKIAVYALSMLQRQEQQEIDEIAR